MCGRLTQHRSWQELLEYYGLIDAPQNLPSRYNIAPTQDVGVIRAGEGGLTHTMMRWWLVPFWWKKPLKDLPTAFNARAEGLSGKQFFRNAYNRRRCIVWADGFYEWKKAGKTKIPHYITRADGAPLSFAGLWESWDNPQEEKTILSCTIVTCAASKAMKPLHSRMPVVLAKSDIAAWLSGDAGEELLVPAPDDALTAYPVSSYVSNSRNEGPDCIRQAPTSAPS